MGAETIYQHLDAYYVTNRTFSSLLDQCTNHGTMMYGFDNSLGSVKTYIDTAIQTAIEDSWEVAV